MENIIKLPLKSLVDGTLVLMRGDNLITAVCIALIIYIVALILSKTTSCVIIWRWFDAVITSIPGLLFLLLIYLLFDSGIESEELLGNIWLNILFIVSFISAMLLSVLSNKKYSGFPLSLFFMFISMAAKLVVMIIVPIFIALFFGAMNHGKKDKRTRVGKQGNQNLIAMAVIAGLAYLLVGGLIKNPGGDEE